MQKKTKLKRAYLIASLVVWALLVFTSYQTAPDLELEQSLYFESSPDFLNNLLLTSFLLLSFLYYKVRISSDDELNINEAIWSSFITAGIMFVGVTITRQLTHLSENVIIINFVYDINIFFLSAYLAKLFYTFKRMVLFQKTRSLLRAWKLFEYLVFGTLILQLVGYPFENYLSVIMLGLIALSSLFLSLNLKWIAYLSTKQKWTNLLVIFLILLISASFLQYIYYESSTLNDVKHYLVNDLSRVVFINGVIIFLIFYSLSTILVMFFNVPTSSVFEKKANEVFNYQKLSHLIQVNKNESEIFNIVFETSYNTALAEAAWLEVLHEDGSHKAYLTFNVSRDEIDQVKKAFISDAHDFTNEEISIKDSSKIDNFDQLAPGKFKSILSTPIVFKNHLLGILCLSKGIEDGFSKEILNIIDSFVSQAGVSIENSRLMQKAIENERYKEEIKIAKEVQKSLLPSHLGSFNYFDIYGYSASADEVGGDYYDVYPISETKTAVVIGDVSGHGTSAAFNMAQLRGVFQGLIRTTKSPEEFLLLANSSISNCLEKNTFITLTIYFLCNETKTISLARAGHCPTLFFNKKENEVRYFENKGLGLGIIRDDSYSNFIDPFQKSFSSGDVLLIYTDGIVESKNPSGDEYGFDRLKTTFKKSHQKDVKETVDLVLSDLNRFSEGEKVDDDYTCLAIKFT